MIPSDGIIDMRKIAAEYNLIKPYDLKTVIDTNDSYQQNQRVGFHDFYGKIRKPIQEMLIYENATDLAAALNTAPPTMEEVFNSWPRFDGANYYTDSSVATGPSASWAFLTNPDRVSQTRNTSSYCGIVSPNNYSSYTFEATLTSDATDDDTIGLVAAFGYHNGVSKSLVAVRTQGGMVPPLGWGILYMENNTIIKVYGEQEFGPVSRSWNNKTTRVRIERNQNIFKFYCSYWNSDVIESSSEIIIDIEVDDPEFLSVFTGENQYGYFSYSQAGSTYLDTSFVGGVDFSQIVSFPTKEIYNYDSQTMVWTSSDLDISSLGYENYIVNPKLDDSLLKIYKTTLDGDFLKIGTYNQLTNDKNSVNKFILIDKAVTQTVASDATRILGIYRETVFENLLDKADIFIDAITPTTITIDYAANEPFIRCELDQCYIRLITNELFRVRHDPINDPNTLNITRVVNYKDITLI